MAWVAAGPAVADSLRVSTPLFALTFVDFWTHAEPPLPLGADARVVFNGATLELFAWPSPSGSDRDTALASRAARLLTTSVPPLRTADTLELLGAHAFTVREYRDTAVGAAEPQMRARLYALHRGGILFLASLRYRPIGCNSTLFTVREALNRLEIHGVIGIAAWRPLSAPDTRQSVPGANFRDALGRRKPGSNSMPTYRPAQGNSKATVRRKPAAPPACFDPPSLPPAG